MGFLNHAAPGSMPIPPAGTWELRHTAHPPEAGRSSDTPDREPPRGPFFAVRVLDNPVNTYQQVMEVCSEALGISFEDAFAIAQTIDTAGSCVVCVAPRPDAERVASHIATIGIEVRLEPAEAPAAGS